MDKVFSSLIKIKDLSRLIEGKFSVSRLYDFWPDIKDSPWKLDFEFNCHFVFHKAKAYMSDTAWTKLENNLQKTWHFWLQIFLNFQNRTLKTFH